MPVGHARRAPTARLGKEKERPKSLRVIVYRPRPQVPRAFLPHDGIVDVGHLNRSQAE